MKVQFHTTFDARNETAKKKKKKKKERFLFVCFLFCLLTLHTLLVDRDQLLNGIDTLFIDRDELLKDRY